MELTAPSSLTRALSQSASVWRALPPHRHLAAVLLLALLATLRWPFLWNSTPLGDEALYLKAFEAVLAGNTPYDVKGYFYPPIFARGGAQLLDLLGSGGTLVVLRGLNLLGLALAFWLATVWLPLSIGRRWLAVVAALCLSPAVHAGLDLGNISFFIVGLALAGLFAWPRRPLLAGLLLGVSIALKPIAAAAIPILAVHRPQRPAGRRHLLTAAIAAAVTGALLLPISGLREMLSQEMVPLAYARSFSLQRLFALFGIDLPRVALTLAAITLATLLARRWTMSSAQLLCFCVATISLATPLVWNHTLIVALPVQGLALAIVWHRLAEGDVLRRRLELAVIGLGVATIHAGTTAGFDHLSPPIQIIFLLALGLTPTAVCAYAFRFAGEG